MADKKNLSPEILLHIAQTLNLPMRGLVAAIELLDDGGTVPFIARYRKESTGNLDEVQILAIEEKLAYFRELADRRETILASIAEQGKLTEELKGRIEATYRNTPANSGGAASGFWAGRSFPAMRNFPFSQDFHFVLPAGRDYTPVRNSGLLVP
jgi:hypothetical protein